MIASKLDDALQQNLSLATPALRQFFHLKHRYPDCLLFYRMGDFYELFFDDAVQASRILNITLTKRGKHGEDDIPMCGVPVHSHEAYLEKLIASGVKVAICEQMENPADAKAKRGYKAIVERDVVRVITPGTITEERLLDARRSNYLASLALHRGQLSLATLELSTGEFRLASLDPAALGETLSRSEPSEILVPDSLLQRDDIAAALATYRLTPQPASQFDPRKGERLLKEHYNVAVLDSLAEFSPADLCACAALMDYLHLTQCGLLPRLDIPRKEGESAYLAIDPATRRNLELVQTLSGEKSGSLLSCIDRTITAPGSRLLARRLQSPLAETAKINRRLDHVDYFLAARELRYSIRAALRHSADLERALSRLHLQRGGPRDLQAIAQCLSLTTELRGLLHQAESKFPGGDASLGRTLQDFPALAATLQQALKTDLPLMARDGNFIAPHYRADLDEWRTLRDEGQKLVAALQQQYSQQTGIANLRIKYNNVLGYHVEINPSQESKVPLGFIHRQSMKNALRYGTVELAELEQKIADAAGKALKLELACYEELCSEVLAQSEGLILTARALAGLDVATALAQLAEEQNYCRPLVDDSRAFSLTAARHPVVEQHRAKLGESFIPNDCTLQDTQEIWLLTGPNMAGKSTFLRQNALIALLAQCGSFVPATTAHLGVADRLYSRVGAADDLARGRSTFMVEMVETATILNQATDRSLVILDEIGRGTATFDGLSIAWAAVEHLHNQNRCCRALFATHYHELTPLAQNLPRLACYSLKVQEWKGDIIFLHQVTPGTANHSYGIHVAALAGLPKAVVSRARQVLSQLEAGQHNPSLPLFAAAPPPSVETPPAPALALLATCKPDELSPRDALEFLYRLHALID